MSGEKIRKSAGYAEFKPVCTVKASEAIYEQIRRSILDGRFKAGDKLPSERTLITQFKRSRPTVREALRMLEQSGLVRIVPGGGATVQHFAASNIEEPLETMLHLERISAKEIYEFRIVLEQAMLAWCVERRTDEDLRAFREIVAAAEGCLGHWETFLLQDLAFHRRIAEAGRNGLVAVVYRVLYRILSETMGERFQSLDAEESLLHQREILECHRNLTRYIEARDLEAARGCLERHLDRYRTLFC
ncbi:FadR/GntR family transcriptional regulator [Aminiphilus circumscriptus]|jgi:GntR family transcriptional repressor for pyruvate dehydrogenase complex|uniref:FadR/GntR family transcriptional regulator n=1 Tax=Aminiphilus circumscriptus TaxID=290732 RepID=UPI0004B1051C|nr:FadR/GntR family transcriptional regulator [Aminiphilus circumscriptus]